jgi:peptidase M23-like protein
MQFSRYGFLLFCFICFSTLLRAQSFSYPQNYFRDPLAVPIQLSANFGELRPNHWHMGLDIRTEQRENLPVYAAADGYIAHLGIRPGSFGQFIIINHPNGYSTLYAHLNSFFPALQQYVTDQQYKQESWAVELDFTAKQFPVSKGSFIALSGNTGGSQGPHLHFEILETKTTKRINPLLFGLPVDDETAPTVSRLALYDRNRSLYEQTPLMYPVQKTDSGYIIPKNKIIKTGFQRVSFAIQAVDKTSSGSSPNGIFSAELFFDEQPQVMFMLEGVDYDETQYINAQIDYRHDYYGGAYFQHLSKMPGDSGPVYKKEAGDGVISLNDTLVHDVSIDIKDVAGNESNLHYFIQYDSNLATIKYNDPNVPLLIPGRKNYVNKPDFSAILPTISVYDTVKMTYTRIESASSTAVSAIHKLNDAYIPLHDPMIISIKPTKQIPDTWKDRLVIIRNAKGSTVRKAKWDGEWLTATFGDFGTFQAFVDLTPPTINDLGKGDTINLSKPTRIIFTPGDNFGVKSFRAELDGSWLRFTNDKGHNWIYIFDERCSYGIHELKVTVEDIAGNSTTKSWWFKRNPYTPPPPKKKATKTKGSSKKKTKKKK